MASGVQWGFAVCMQCLQDYFSCFSINVNNYKINQCLVSSRERYIPVETLLVGLLQVAKPFRPQFPHLPSEGVGLDNH